MGVADGGPESGLPHQSQAIWIDERSGQVVETAASSDHAWTRAFSRHRELTMRAQSTQARMPGQQRQFSFVSGRTRPLSSPLYGLRRLPARGGAP
jgi:hypothetical protein